MINVLLLPFQKVRERTADELRINKITLSKIKIGKYDVKEVTIKATNHEPKESLITGLDSFFRKHNLSAYLWFLC